MKKMKHILLVSILIILSGCSNDAALKKRAYELAHEFIITDGHIDVPWRLNDGYEDLSIRTEGGDFDYVRAKEGGLDAPFMSVYVPSSYQETGGAKEKADSLIDLVNRIADDHPDKFEVATSVDDVNRIFADGKIALPMGMENGAPLMDDLSNVEYFYDRGIRYITLTHGKDNLICDSSYDTTRTWGGLSPFGREVVKEMNRVGIMVDISHVTDEVINQVLDMTDVPVIASHSSCRYFTPGWERNMGDDEIRRLKDNGGVIQINYGSSFVTQASQDKRAANAEKIKVYADKGNPIIGICNGFQILVEAGLVPGVLLRNKYLEFVCKNVFIKINSKKNIKLKKIFLLFKLIFILSKYIIKIFFIFLFFFIEIKYFF